MSQVKGACTCGNVSVSFPKDIATTVSSQIQPDHFVATDGAQQGICYCGACRKVGSSAFSVNAFMSEDSLKVTGETRPYTMKGKSTSGKDIHLYFCPTCSSAIYTAADAYPGMVAVKTGILDSDPGEDLLSGQFAPKVESWTCKRPGWLGALKDTVQFEQSPSA